MIIDNKKYKNKLGELTLKVVEKSQAPRGRIYDRNYNIIVDNKAVKVIYYQKDKSRTKNAEIKLAYLLSPHITLYISILSNDIKKDFFLFYYVI